MDHDKVMEFLGQVRRPTWARPAPPARWSIGNRLGLYRALAEGPATPGAVRRAHRVPPALPHRVAARPGRRRVRQLRPGDRRVLPDRGAGVLPGRPERPQRARRRSSPCSATCAPNRSITEAFRTGAGVGWHEHDDDVFVGCDAFYRPGYVAELVPQLDPGAGRRRGEADRRRPGRRRRLRPRARPRCCSPQAYPRSTVVGSDYHAESIELARKKAAEAGVGDRVSFEVATAQTFTGTGLRPGDDVRLPARHGRPGRRRPAGPRGAGPGRHLAAGRAVRRRHGRGQLQPGRPAVLQRLARSSACPTRCPSRAATRSARRPARPRSARSPPRPASPGSGGPRRPRSTWSTRSGPDHDPCAMATVDVSGAGYGAISSARARHRSPRRPHPRSPE